MKMSFGVEITGIVSIIVLVLFLSEYLLPRNKKIQDFFIRNKKWLSPNAVSNWRKHGGIPTLLLYIFGFTTENEIILYSSIWIFTFLAICDRLDGQIARSCDMQTEEGKVLDAEADKWFDLPMLNAFGLFPILEPLYLIITIPMTIFEYIGQRIRGKNSPAGAGLVGKIKTSIKFVTIYMMTMYGRYDYGYELFKLEILIIVSLFIALIAAGASMSMKTKWYNYNIRIYIENIMR